MNHWKLKGDKEITAFIRVVSEDTTIAIVHDGESRAVRQMLRYAQLGEQVEEVMD